MRFLTGVKARGAFVLVAVALGVACGDEEPVPNGANSGAGGQGGASAGTGSSGMSAKAGSAGMSGGGSAQAGTAGGGAGGASAGASAGGAMAGTGGTPNAGTGGTDGVGGASAGVAGNAGTGAGTGGDAGNAGSAGSGAGSSGAAGAAGAAGASGGSGLQGGASAAFVCPAGPFGDPLEGMGSVVNIGPPTQGQPNYFAFVEGPVWIGSLGKLFFSDNVQPERIWQLTPGGMPSVFLENSGSNGLAIDGDDQLVVADQAGRRITGVDPSSSSPSASPIIADAGCKPNDLIVRSDGNIYYTAPNESGSGFYRADPNGMRTGPRSEVNAPNGIVLSPGENTLYVGDVGNRSITAFSIAADGSIGATATPFATAMGQTVDGMCVDCAGNVYAGTQSGVEVFSPAGARLGTVPTGEASNCTFGGTDRKTLYVTSRALVKSVTLGVPGLPD